MAHEVNISSVATNGAQRVVRVRVQRAGQAIFYAWKILRFFSYSADVSAADLYYVIKPVICCQSGFLR